MKYFERVTFVVLLAVGLSYQSFAALSIDYYTLGGTNSSQTGISGELTVKAGDMVVLASRMSGKLSKGSVAFTTSVGGVGSDFDQTIQSDNESVNPVTALSYIAIENGGTYEFSASRPDYDDLMFNGLYVISSDLPGGSVAFTDSDLYFSENTASGIFSNQLQTAWPNAAAAVISVAGVNKNSITQTGPMTDNHTLNAMTVMSSLVVPDNSYSGSWAGVNTSAKTVASGAMAAFVEVPAGAPDDRPNFIFILTDDQSYLAAGYAGNPDIITPEMDQLSTEGVVFDRHYNTTAICMASRACIMSGMLEYKTGANFQHGAMTDAMFDLSYPMLLKGEGYHVGFAGKFGFAVTPEPSGTSNDGTFDNMPVDLFDDWAGGLSQTDYDTAGNFYMTDYADEFPHSSRAYAAWTEDFIGDAVTAGKPFCASVFFKAPHLSWTPDPALDHLYDGKTFSKPANFGHDYAKHLSKQPRMGRQYLSYFEKRIYFKDEATYNDGKRDYYQLITGVDVALGVIREALESYGVSSNTVIVFTSDNGYSEGAHGFAGKCLPYEEPSRAPMIIYDPRAPGNGRRVAAVTAGIDIAPTLLEMAEIDIPSNVDGRSLTALLDDSAPRVRDSLPLIQVWGSAPTHSLGVVSEDWKYIYWAFEGDGMVASEELYHNTTDPLELNNLAGDPDYAASLSAMRVAYDGHLGHWKTNALPYNNYAQYGTIFDRTIPWTSKENLYSAEAMNDYTKELNWMATDSYAALDQDGDGLTDGEELEIGLNPLLDDLDQDDDGDGVSNADELGAGTDLFDVGSVFEVKDFVLNGSELGISWSSVSGRTYQVDYSTNLVDWVALAGAENLVSTGGVMTLSGISSLEGAQFYRAVIQVP